MKIEMRISLFIIALWLTSVASAFDTAFAPPIDPTFLDQASANFGISYPDYQVPGVWHCGLDIGCPEGTEIRAIDKGVIAKCSPSGWDLDTVGQNYAMIVKHHCATGESFTAYYGHMSRPTNPDGSRYTDQQIRNYRIGETVTASEVLGTIGHYDNSPHLHFGIYCNLQNPYDFPFKGYGMQPLPRPPAEYYQSVLHYGNWYEPRGWLRTFYPLGANCEFGCLMPVASDNNEHFFYLQQEQSEQIVMIANPDGKASVSLWKAPDDHRVLDLFAGPSESVFAKTKTASEYWIWLIRPGEQPKFLLERSSDFDHGAWQQDTNCFPIRLGVVWDAFDLEKGVRSVNEVLGADITGPLAGIGKKEWSLISSKVDPGCGKERLISCYIIATDKQSENWVDVPINGDLRRPVGLETRSQNDPDDSQWLVFAARTTANFNLNVGLIEPVDGDPFHNGYHVSRIRPITMIGEDILCNSRITIGGSEKILAVSPVGGRWQVFSLDIDGKNLTQLTGSTPSSTSSGTQGQLNEK